MRSLRLLAVIAGLGVCVAGCRSSTEPTSADNTQVVTGTVRFFQFEGGFYAIRTGGNIVYDPTNLAPQFQHDGLRVRARVLLRNDLVGVHAAGPIVDIESIEPLWN